MIVEIMMLVLLLGLIGIGTLFTDDGEYMRAQEDNVSVYEIGHPFLFGRSRVRVYYGDYVFTAAIANDGAALTDENFEIEKNGEFYEVTLKGSEQRDVTYYLKEQETKY
ncbi:MAG: hypothetical protein PHW47_01940 [Lachnospira sp.]|nr:hypothetical protein [Lachnospira sp.]